MKNIKLFEEFVNEKNMLEKKQQYLDKTLYYKNLVKKLGVKPVDGVYECHEWVYNVMESGKAGKNTKFFLFDERKESAYYKKAESLDKEFKNIFKKLGPGHYPYFEYILGHSFIQDDGIFIDLTLDTEGLSFEDIQIVDNKLSKLNIY